MKTTLLITILLLIGMVSKAQWTTKYYVDEFGDKTAESYNMAVLMGEFSNSVTDNSKCIYRLMDSGTELSIYPYEYRSQKAHFQSDFGEVKIKRPDGVVVTLDAFFASNAVYFSKKNYYKVMKTLDSGAGIYKIAFSQERSYYKFEITL